MEAKKNSGLDQRRYVRLCTSIGFAVTLILVNAAFQWRFVSNDEIDLAAANQFPEMDPTIVPVTNITPPMPVPRPVILVEDDPEDETTEVPVIDQHAPWTPYIHPVPPIEPEPELDLPIDVVEEPANPIGGLQAFYAYIAKELKGKYPRMAIRLGIQGKVFVEFTVERDGQLSDVKIIKGIGGGCDELALKVVASAPAWHPGKQRGRPVRQRCTLPIFFKID